MTTRHQTMQALLTPWRRAWAARAAALHLPDDERERGDVPGWVLVTLMTAGLVVALWAVAGPGLAGIFETAINSVSGP
ncbi:hypothetical protein ACGIF2_06115 [Cellulomonas sp. P22]|uniref:hypothetical protein n=1 Tax=Cellulomonas sp. P22 TaxID=3373189 RepID=UPI0037A489A4